MPWSFAAQLSGAMEVWRWQEAAPCLLYRPIWRGPSATRVTRQTGI